MNQILTRLIEVQVQEGIDLKQDGDQTFGRASAIMTAAGAIGVLSAIALGMLMSRSITIPLARITGVAAEMADGRLDTSLLAGIASRDETGVLARTFVLMARRLKQTLEGLHKSNDELEMRVQERTIELTMTKEAAEAASQAKSVFLTNMSHELRTPFEFNLPDLVHSVLSSTQIKADARGLAMQYEELSPIPKTVRGDARKLRQVLLNLLDNVGNYTEKGGVTLRVRGKERIPGGRQDLDISPSLAPVMHLSFQIDDTGIGIPAEKIEEIFDPFTQGPAEGRRTEGVGLGLSISRRLATLMGGKLAVESKVGQGSTFTLELDLEVVEGGAATLESPRRHVLGYHGERKRLLIVDDNIENLTMLVSFLEPLQFEILTAENGKEALRNAKESGPDLILLDLLMPVMDGDEALRQIRSDKNLDRIKVIGVTAAVADRVRSQKFASACDNFLSKPIQTAILLDKLKVCLGLEWIEEQIAVPVSGASGLEHGSELKPAKLPPRAILDEIMHLAQTGAFTRLERLLDELERKDGDYRVFCARMRESAGRYDDEAIIQFIDSEGGNGCSRNPAEGQPSIFLTIKGKAQHGL